MRQVPLACLKMFLSAWRLCGAALLDNGSVHKSQEENNDNDKPRMFPSSTLQIAMATVRAPMRTDEGLSQRLTVFVGDV